MSEINKELLKSIDKPIEDVIHDLSLLRVKSKMESGQVTTLGDMINSYADSVDDLKCLFKQGNLKDFIKS